MIFTASRASAVLYSFLKSNAFSKPFLLPANACPVVPLSFLKAGVDFKFVDIDETHAMSKELAKKEIEQGEFAGLLFIHAYGKKFDNKIFYQELKENHPDFCIIDDCCLCPPELSDNLPNNIDLALYSTGYAKYVELLFGGYGVVRNSQMTIHDSQLSYSENAESRQQKYLKECLSKGIVYELPADYPWLDVSPLSISQKQYFDTIQQKILAVHTQRDRINSIYRALLPKDIQWGTDYYNWRFMVSVENRDKILEAIFKNGLFAGVNYQSVSYLFKKQNSPQAEKEAMHTLNLINNHRVDEAFVTQICEVINTYLI